jgi:hypothetical protein
MEAILYKRKRTVYFYLIQIASGKITQITVLKKLSTEMYSSRGFYNTGILKHHWIIHKGNTDTGWWP